ncbi:MAG: flagellar hook-associated protein FlgL [Bacillota bacterium]
MRVTNSMLTDGFMRNLRTNLKGLDVIQRKLSSGKEVNRPSDDPVRLQQILNLDTAQDQTEQFLRNIDNASSYLATTEGALNQAMSLLSRASELGTRSLNGSNNQEAMDATAQEVKQLLEQLVEVANTAHTGRYVFAGTDTTTKPYSINTADLTVTSHSAAKDGSIEYEVGPGVKMAINTTGSAAFGEIQSANSQDAFTALKELADAMHSDNKTAVGAAMDKLEKASDKMLTSRTDLGARMNRLEATEDRYQEDLVNIKDLKSKSADADMAYVIMELKTQESVYQASLAAGARIIQPSLVDFLR